MMYQIAKAKAITIFAKTDIKSICSKTEQVIEKAVKEEKSTKIKEPKWQRRFPFSFFYGGGKFQPIYFFVFIFSSLASWMLYVKIHAASLAIRKETYSSDMISTGDLTVVLGFVSSLILLYNNSKKTKIIESKPIIEEKESGN